MGHLSIYCDGCGSSWNVYHRDDLTNWRAKTCPVCGKSIDSEIYGRKILKIFEDLEDVNKELVLKHEQSHGTLFTVGYIPDVIFPNRQRSSLSAIVATVFDELLNTED